MESAAEHVRQCIRAGEQARFWRVGDFLVPSAHAVEVELSRLAADHELVRVRKGLYWRGRRTRFGIVRPSPLEVALAVGGPGAGPAGTAAAHFLGLTTQVPATVAVAVPGRAPKDFSGVRFCARPIERRLRELRPAEVAVLELLRDPAAAESSWRQVLDRVRTLTETSEVRAAVLTDEVGDEPVIAVRRRWQEVLAA